MSRANQKHNRQLGPATQQGMDFIAPDGAFPRLGKTPLGLRIDPKIRLCNRNVDHFDPEIVIGLVKSRMCRVRHNDFRCLDILLRMGKVPVGFHRHDNAFGAAGGHRAANLIGRIMVLDRITVEHFGRH